MYAFLGFISMIGFFACAIMLIKAKVKKNGKVKKWGIGTGACFVIFVLALIITPGLTPEQIAQAKTADELKVKQAEETEAKVQSDKIIADAKAKIDAEAKEKVDAQLKSEQDARDKIEADKVAEAKAAADKVAADAKAVADKKDAEAKVVAETKAKETVGQKNALRSAEGYLKTMPFSKTGLIEQLKFSGFSIEDATYGANNSGADWKAQAVKAAEAYLKTMPFSKTRLIEQLEFSGYTHDQAVFGVLATGL